MAVLTPDASGSCVFAERRAQEKMVPVYEKRRAVVKAINKFWPVALMNHEMIGVHAQHNADQAALSYLEDVWLVRDPVESRCFTLEFVSNLSCLLGNPPPLHTPLPHPLLPFVTVALISGGMRFRRFLSGCCEQGLDS